MTAVHKTPFDSRIKLRHLLTGCRLHSHGATYPAGSEQQQVAGHAGEDDNDYWVGKPARDGEDGRVTSGTTIRLEHFGFNFHSLDNRRMFCLKRHQDISAQQVGKCE